MYARQFGTQQTLTFEPLVNLSVLHMEDFPSNQNHFQNNLPHRVMLWQGL